MLWLGDSPFVLSFIISGGIEEFIKWFIVFFIVFDHELFNEPYDGVIYTVAVSLGFATLENVLYAFALPADPFILLIRALLPVSGHALFAVIMGFYYGKAKFSAAPRRKMLAYSILLPVVIHGMFDYIQLAFTEKWSWTIIPFVALLWICAMILVRKALDRSPFRYLLHDEMVNPSTNGQ